MNANSASFIEARNFLLAHRLDYKGAYRDFRWPALSDFNWALQYFDVIANGNHRTALHIVNEDGSEVKRTFAQLSEKSSQVANYFRSIGVRRGDRILLMLGNELPLWEVMLAAMKLGAVIVPTTAQLAVNDLQDRLQRGNVRYVVAGSEQAAKFEGLVGGYIRISVGEPLAGWLDYETAVAAATEFVSDGPTRATDPLLLYFTSGTTSKPKLVLHTHQSYPVGHLSTMYWIGLLPGDVHLNISSPGWAKHAWSCFFAPWNAEACIFIYKHTRFDAKGLLSILENHRITSLCAPPTVWRMLIQEDLSVYSSRICLRELIGAGEPLNPEIIEKVRAAWGLSLRDGYGQTETTAQVGNTPGQELKPGSMGRPLPGYCIDLLDLDGKLANEGEVCLPLAQRPIGLMLGYQDGELSNDAMRDGHYHTGDIGRRDADGFITFIGRADDVFKASDYRISPFELESVLMEHEAVIETAVVPSPDPVRLSVPKAFIILRHGVEPSAVLAQEIFNFSRSRLTPFKRIRRIEFVQELPKTISGKIRRVQLRNEEEARVTTNTQSIWAFSEER